MDASAGLPPRRREIDAQGLEENYRSVIETVVDGVITIDALGVVQSFNPAAERIFGYTAVEVVGRNVRMLMPEPYRGEHDRYVENHQRTGVRKIIGIGREVTGLRRDGSTFPMDLAVSEFQARGQRHYTGVVRDITERKRLEQALRERAMELESANRRKDEFVGMLGHELRNPLSAIQASIDLLRRSAAREPSLDRPREIIARQVQHLSRLVDDLLDITRLTRGTLALRREVVTLAPLVERAIEIVHAELHRRGQTVVVTERSPRPLRIEADPARIAQSIANLLHNASKFSADGERIDIESGIEEGRAVLRVRDRGCGISPELLPQVFELFAASVPWNDGAHGGLGIGLQLVKSLVEMHGGSAGASSEGPGRGSVFTIKLPLVPAPLPGTEALAERAPAVPRPAGPDGDEAAGADVLVVDDNVDGAEALAMLLEALGHRPRIAHTGRAGIDEAQRRKPDLLLLDIGLPDLDGFEVARLLRADPATAGLRLVALTGYGRPQDRERSRHAGFDDHLTKPVSVEKLLRLLAPHAADPATGAGR